MKIYLASSWRNQRQPEIVETLRAAGHEVYDFRNPRPGVDGFDWADIDPDWQQWSPEQFKAALNDPIAVHGFGLDLEAMQWAEVFVLLMPCGRSAHLEAGWAIGAGKPTAILLSDGEPELMYRLAGDVVTTVDQLLAWLNAWAKWGDGPSPTAEAIGRFEEGEDAIARLKRLDAEALRPCRCYELDGGKGSCRPCHLRDLMAALDAIAAGEPYANE